MPASLCIFAKTCGNALALEHNGDLYSCDHFVEPKFLLGNIREQHLIQLVASDQQRKFGNDKQDSLPRYCRECEVKFACNGECPRNRFIQTPDGEPGLNYLCAGYKAFFKHIDHPMKLMVDLLLDGREAPDVMRDSGCGIRLFNELRTPHPHRRRDDRLAVHGPRRASALKGQALGTD